MDNEDHDAIYSSTLLFIQSRVTRHGFGFMPADGLHAFDFAVMSALVFGPWWRLFTYHCLNLPYFYHGRVE